MSCSAAEAKYSDIVGGGAIVLTNITRYRRLESGRPDWSCLRPDHRDEAQEVHWAAIETGKSERTIRNWCVQYGMDRRRDHLGRHYGRGSLPGHQHSFHDEMYCPRPLIAPDDAVFALPAQGHADPPCHEQ